jgi:hypothetical protein
MDRRMWGKRDQGVIRRREGGKELDCLQNIANSRESKGGGVDLNLSCLDVTMTLRMVAYALLDCGELLMDPSYMVSVTKEDPFLF